MLPLEPVSGDPPPKARSVPGGDDTLLVSTVGGTMLLDVTGRAPRSSAEWLISPAPAKAMVVVVSGVVGADAPIGVIVLKPVSGVVGTDAPIGEIVLKPVSALGGS